jgi:hypothetical protein
MDDELVMWTVYDHPPDFPGHFVARKFVMRVGVPFATMDALFALDLPSLRAKLPPGLYCLDRQQFDLAFIVETWM